MSLIGDTFCDTDLSTNCHNQRTALVDISSFQAINEHVTVKLTCHCQIATKFVKTTSQHIFNRWRDSLLVARFVTCNYQRIVLKLSIYLLCFVSLALHITIIITLLLSLCIAYQAPRRNIRYWLRRWCWHKIQWCFHRRNLTAACGTSGKFSYINIFPLCGTIFSTGRSTTTLCLTGFWCSSRI